MSIPKSILIHTLYAVLLLACSPALIADEAEKKGRGDALIEAVRKGDGTAASALLANGADANARDHAGTTALMWAALDASPDTMNALLDKGANVNACNDAGATALMYAVSSLKKILLLLGRGAQVDARDENGCTALILAAGYDGPVEIVMALVDRGADVNARVVENDDFGLATPLMRAAASRDRDKVALLLHRGADARASKKRAGSTALAIAAMFNDIPTVKLLLDRGADIEARTRFDTGRTVLMDATYYGFVDLMGVLLDRGADLEARDDLGMTALMWAASNDDGDVEALELLLARGADRDAKDKAGKTARSWAKDARPTPSPAMILLASPVPASRRGLPADRAAAAGRAVERSIPLLERSGPGFFEGASGLCVSCHHQSLPALALAAARERGFRVDEALTRRRVKQTLATMPKRAKILDDVGSTALNPSSGVSYFLVGLAADGQPPSGTTEALVHQLAGRQAKDGRWPTSVSRRAPLEYSDVTGTALATRALKAYAPPGRAGEMAERIRRAAAWLASVAPRTTEDRSFQLLGLAWAEGQPAAIRKGAAALLAEQRPDGGWAQVPSRASDAYATGQALVALHRAGVLPVDTLAYQRGVDFLLGSQYEDGSWLVETRSHPHNRLPYFETGFPHEESQFISCAGTAWATWALALSAAPPLNERRADVDATDGVSPPRCPVSS